MRSRTGSCTREKDEPLPRSVRNDQDGARALTQCLAGDRVPAQERRARTARGSADDDEIVRVGFELGQDAFDRRIGIADGVAARDLELAQSGDAAFEMRL